MRQGSVLIVLGIAAVCACSSIGAPAASNALKVKEAAAPQPAQLSGTWYRGLGMGGGCWITLRFDHTLTVQTAGCISGEPLVTANWAQKADKILLVNFVHPVVDPQTFPKEHFRSNAEFWSQEALFQQQNYVRTLFGSGLTIFAYQANTVLVPEESLAYVRRHGYNRAWCFWRDFSATGGGEWPKAAEVFDEPPAKK